MLDPTSPSPLAAPNTFGLETPEGTTGSSASPQLWLPGWFARQEQGFALREHVLHSEMWTPF